jgi:beta-lactamase regulating signal transducer with metallopeptidase domain
MNTMTWLQQGAAWAWHTSLVMAVPGLILLVLGRWRGFSARWRMALAAVLFVRLLMPVVPELPGRPAISLGETLPSAIVHVTPRMVAESETVTQAREAGAVMSTTMASGEARLLTTPRVSWQEVAAGIWALGVLGVAGWLMGSQWVLGRWVSRQAAAPEARLERLIESCCERMGLERRVGLVELPGITTAAVWGWLRPEVLIPANLRETHSTDEIRGILLLELAHV